MRTRRRPRIADISVSTAFDELPANGRELCSLAPSASGRLSMNFHNEGGSASYNLSKAEARLSWNGPPVTADSTVRLKYSAHNSDRENPAAATPLKTSRFSVKAVLPSRLTASMGKPAWVSASRSRRMVRSETPSPATSWASAKVRPLALPSSVSRIRHWRTISV